MSKADAAKPFGHHIPEHQAGTFGNTHTLRNQAPEFQAGTVGARPTMGYHVSEPMIGSIDAHGVHRKARNSGEPAGAPPPMLGLLSWQTCYPELFTQMVTAFFSGDDSFDADVGNAGLPSDFTPDPTAELIVGSGGEPDSSRLLLAISDDGETWVKTGEIVCNHASVPCLAVEDDTLYLFFNVLRNPMDPRPTPLAVASTTNLVEWAYRYIGDHNGGFVYTANVADLNRLEAQDPSVVPAHDDNESDIKWFLYFTLGNKYDEDGVRIGEDTGISTRATYIAGARSLHEDWKQGNRGLPVFPPPSELGTPEEAEDPNVVWIDEAGGFYQYYAGNVTGGKPVDNHDVHLASDGVSVVSDTKVKPTCNGSDIVLTNGADVAGQRKWYGQVGVPRSRREYINEMEVDTTGAIVGGTDTTSASCGPLMVADQSYEGRQVKDAAVVKFRDCYVMVYVSDIPNPTTRFPATPPADHPVHPEAVSGSVDDNATF